MAAEGICTASLGFEGLRAPGVGWAANRGSEGFLRVGPMEIGGNSGTPSATVVGSRLSGTGQESPVLRRPHV